MFFTHPAKLSPALCLSWDNSLKSYPHNFLLIKK